jgi:integrase
MSQIKSPDRAMTVTEWYGQWRALYKENSGITAKSLAGYDEKFRKYLQPTIGARPVRDVREVDLQQILNGAAGMSYSHLTKLRSLLQQLFFRAQKVRLIGYNPADGLQLPACKRGARRSLTAQERALFLAVEPTVPGGIVYYAMLMTGMRPGELTALTWADVDFDANEIHVDKAIESGTRETIKSTKTAAGNRAIPMRSALAERLWPLRGEPDAPVFVREDGTRHNAGSLYRLWRVIRREMAAAQGAPVADDLVAYCLRHTFCTDLQDAGVAINVAKELMGHSNIATTANVYTHRNTQTLHNSIALLDRTQKAHVPVDKVVEKCKTPKKTPISRTVHVKKAITKQPPPRRKMQKKRHKPRRSR